MKRSRPNAERFERDPVEFFIVQEPTGETVLEKAPGYSYMYSIEYSLINIDLILVLVRNENFHFWKVSIAIVIEENCKKLNFF